MFVLENEIKWYNLLIFCVKTTFYVLFSQKIVYTQNQNTKFTKLRWNLYTVIN